MNNFVEWFVGMMIALAIAILTIAFISVANNRSEVAVVETAPAVAVDNGGQVAEAFVDMNEQNVDFLEEVLDSQQTPWLGIGTVFLAVVAMIMSLMAWMMKHQSRTIEKVVEAAHNNPPTYPPVPPNLMLPDQRAFVIDQLRQNGIVVLNPDDVYQLPQVEVDGRLIEVAPKQLGGSDVDTH